MIRATRPWWRLTAIGSVILGCGLLVARASADRSDETLVVLEEDEPQSPYPFAAHTMSEQRLAELLFDRLFVRSESGYFDTAVFGDGGRARPPRLQLEVEEGLRFADGSVVTFADVAYSVDEVYRNCGVAPDVCGWYGMVFGDAHQITDRIGEMVFQVSMPLEEPEQYLTTTTLLSRAALDPDGDGAPGIHGTRRKPVGSGPFWAAETIESYDDVTLQRNPYRGGGEGAVASLRLLYDQDAARQKELMLGRKADLWVAPPPSVIPEFSTQTETFKVTPYELNQWWYVAVDTADPLLSDTRVRQALDHLIPRSQLMEKFGGSSAQAIVLPISTGSNPAIAQMSPATTFSACILLKPSKL